MCQRRRVESGQEYLKSTKLPFFTHQRMVLIKTEEREFDFFWAEGKNSQCMQSGCRSPAMTYLGQSYLGPGQLRPGPLRPVLFRPGLLRPSLLRPAYCFLFSSASSSSSPLSSFFVLLHLLSVFLRFLFSVFVPST